VVRILETIYLTGNDHIIRFTVMGEAVRKITANIPAKLLEQARETTGLGITETLVAGLEELERSRKRSALRMLRGKVRFELDLAKTRR
jgi:hypothetical protein